MLDSTTASQIKNCENQISVIYLPVCNLEWFITESFSTATNPCQTIFARVFVRVFSFLRAQTNCELFVLTKKDLDEVLTHYPQISKKIRETAEERQRMVAERMKKFAKKKEEDKKREEESKLKVCWNSWFKDNRTIRFKMTEENQCKKMLSVLRIANHT